MSVWRRWVCIAVLCFCGVLLMGCGDEVLPEPEPVCGGTIDTTDAAAPKVIQSRDIEAFSVAFYLFDEIDEARSGRYSYSVRKLENEAYEVESDGVYKHTMALTKAQVDGLQDIIDDYALVKSNGVSRTTAGLPPEYQPMYIDVVYASGETLYFYINGDPYAAWTLAFRDYFDSLFTEGGFTDTAPNKEASQIEKFAIEFNVDNMGYHYGIIEDTDDEMCYYTHVYDMTNEETVRYTFAHFEDEIYESLQALIEKYDLDVLDLQNVTFNNPSTPEGFLNIYVDYVNGRQIYGECTSDEIPEQWFAARDEMIACMDTYIETHYKRDFDR